CRGARSTLSGRPRHADQAGQGLLTTQELGDADRPPRRHAQGAVVAMDPRTLAPRDPKATRPRTGPARTRSFAQLQAGPGNFRRVATASPPFPRRPARGVLGLLRMTPGGLTFPA